MARLVVTEENTQQSSNWASSESESPKGGITLKRHGNLWEKLTSKENLELAYLNARRNKGWQRQVREMDMNKDINLESLREMLLNKTYEVSPYKERTIYEPKERKIYVALFYPDRIVHHALMNIIAPIYDNMFIYDSYSCRVGKGQHKGSMRCMQFTRRNNYVLQCDISKFYPSIKHDILLRIIEKKIKDRDVLWLIEKIVRSFPDGHNVPIGNYTSQWFGNIYMNELDVLLKQKYKVRDYIRYCDDFLIFGNDKERLNELAGIIKDFCNNTLKLKLSKLTIFPTKQGVDFLGYRHFPNGKLLVRKSTVKRFKKKLKELRWKLRHGLADLDRARSTVDSISGWICHAQSYHLRKSLGLDELRDEIMKGLPKHLNTKEDYYYIKNNFDEAYWKPQWQLLLDSRYEWFFVKYLDIRAEGIEDNTHKIVEERGSEEDEVRYSQYEYRENPNAKIYKLGFTIEEVERALKG